MIRTPLLSFDELLGWSEGLSAASAGADLEHALEADRGLLRARLQALLERPDVREALFLASPSLAGNIGEWLAAPDGDHGSKIERSLVRYLARMAGRATPFGLFAGCSLGRVSDGGARHGHGHEPTRLVTAGRAEHRRHTRLDMDYLFALTEALARDPGLRRRLRHRPNSSLYRAAGRLRWIRAESTGPDADALERSYRLIAADTNEALERTLARSRDGATIEELAAALVVDDPELASEDAHAFVVELVDAQLLVAELAPTVTGPEPIHDLIDSLARLSTTEDDLAARAARTLGHVRDELRACDDHGLGVDPLHYSRVAEMLAQLPAPVRMQRLVQVDLHKPAPEAVLGAELRDELVGAVELLLRLTAPEAHDELAAFREAFRERYEQREVPLVEVLDEESGVGFPVTAAGVDVSPLLAELALPDRASPSPGPWDPVHRLLLRKLGEALAAGADEIVLTPRDLAEIAVERRPLPDSIAVMATVAACSEQALAAGDCRIHVHHVTGPSGARLLGRFCHGDPALAAATRELLCAEQAHDPGAIYAEIVHLPQGRLGNVLLRPLLREYEIPWLGRSGAPRERQIPVDDLLVSVVGDRVVLRSRRLDRPVVPRMSNAHNFGGANLGTYRFLCALQTQGHTRGSTFGWGPLESTRYLPRVVYGKIVLAPARWRLERAELESLVDLRGAPLFRMVQGLRSSLRLVRHLVVADGDNQLPIDLDNVLSVETFAQLIKNRPHVTLIELAPGPTELLARGPEGRFVHELVLPCTRAVDPSRAPTRVAGRPSSPAALRTFPPGSEWLYAKLYGGTSSADAVLGAVVRPLVGLARESGAADRWFFIRYADPHPHVRLRLHGRPERLLAELLPLLRELAAPLLADGRIARVQLDTYEREVERYGGPVGIELAERIFEADSDAALDLIERWPGDAGTDVRWRLALLGMDRLFADLELELPLRRAIIDRARESFGREHGVDNAVERQLAGKYRKLRADLDALLAPTGAVEHGFATELEVLARRSLGLAAAGRELLAAEAAGSLTVPIPRLVTSYVHMSVNRLLRGSHRAQELVLYDLLSRLYESRAARARATKARAAEPKAVAV